MARILYISQGRIPTEKAHGVQIMKMCEAYAMAGHEVELIVPHRTKGIATDPFEFYGIPRTFRITPLFAVDLDTRGRLAFWIQRLSFSISAFSYVLRSRADLVHSRDDLTLALISPFRDRAVYEEHDGRWNLLVRRVVRAYPVIVITEALKRFFLERNVPESRIHVAPDSVDLELFKQRHDRDAIRRMLDIQNSMPLIMYTGHLYAWKGVDTLAEAMKEIPEAMCIFVGGTDKDILRFRGVIDSQPNIRLLGHKPHNDMPRFLQAADVLVLPNSARESISRLYTSPLKLFEYMASGRPIVASDLPSIREVLTDREAYFARPDDPGDLARAIRVVLESRSEASGKAEAALNKVQRFSWKARARSILTALN